MEAGKLKSVTQTISLIVGLALIVMGLVGFLFPSLSGLHLSNFHCAIMAISGGTLFYNAFKDNDRDLFISCLCFGIYFALHAVAGFAFANSVNSVNSSSNPELLRMIPNFTELGIVDHILNGIIGIVLMGGALDWWRVHHERRRWNRHDRRRQRLHPIR